MDKKAVFYHAVFAPQVRKQSVRLVSFLIPLSHYDHESHESPRIDNFLDSWLNRYQFVKFLPVSYIFAVSYNQSGIRGKSFELFKYLATNSRFQKIIVNS